MLTARYDGLTGDRDSLHLKGKIMLKDLLSMAAVSVIATALMVAVGGGLQVACRLVGALLGVPIN